MTICQFILWSIPVVVAVLIVRRLRAGHHIK